uniref:CSON014189 protein n=1 Tax=Culicoides sonorensis TaxID=179676 RepID=A0A336KRP9_CULSO
MAEVESVSPVPSTSNLMNPMIPTTITAEIRVEPQQQASSTSSPATTTNTSTALIVAPTNNNNNNNNSSNNQDQENTTDTGEPEPKRKKIDTPVKASSKMVEKLEARLGGILCCAVCLDLPRTAMYQVIILYYLTYFFF